MLSMFAWLLVSWIFLCDVWLKANERLTRRAYITVPWRVIDLSVNDREAVSVLSLSIKFFLYVLNPKNDRRRPGLRLRTSVTRCRSSRSFAEQCSLLSFASSLFNSRVRVSNEHCCDVFHHGRN